MGGSKNARVFLDTNVILSGLHSPQGPPGVILDRSVSGGIDMLISRQVLDETIRVVREKLPHALPALRRFLEHDPPEICPGAGPARAAAWAGLLDAEDAAILAAAEAAKPDYFVTGDRHFLDNPAIASRSGLAIVSPAGLLEALDG